MASSSSLPPRGVSMNAMSPTDGRPPQFPPQQQQPQQPPQRMQPPPPPHAQQMQPPQQHQQQQPRQMPPPLQMPYPQHVQQQMVSPMQQSPMGGPPSPVEQRRPESQMPPTQSQQYMMQQQQYMRQQQQMQQQQQQQMQQQSLPPNQHQRYSSAVSMPMGLAGAAGSGFVEEGGETARQQRQVSQSVPLLDQSHLRPGKEAALLSHDRTLELYRENAKKTNDPELMFEFSVFMIDAAKSMNVTNEAGSSSVKSGAKAPAANAMTDKRDELIKEAVGLLKKLADKGFPDAQYFLADCFANGIGTTKGRQDFDKAYPLFVLAAKHGHPDACYRAGTCCEHGWGCRQESAKAIQYYKKAAVGLHPGAMYRLGNAELNGQLGLKKSPKEGVKWLKRSAEHATEEYPHALHELALLHERGVDNVVFEDNEYAAELLAQAAELGYAPSAFKLGECYEYGKMDCPLDPALSIHYYNIAATQGHADSCFALTAWYLVGSPGVLPQSDTEAYLWARKAAEAGLAKAMYAVGYFTETGIGTPASPQDAIGWYKRAAEGGDKRAAKRLASGNSGSGRNTVLDRRVEMEALKEEARLKRQAGGEKGDNCVIM